MIQSLPLYVRDLLDRHTHNDTTHSMHVKTGFHTRTQFWVFAFLAFAFAGLTGLHWIKNPYQLAVWIQSSDVGSVTIQPQCEGTTTSPKEINAHIAAGYYQYDFSLPKCRIDKLTISAADNIRNRYEIASATVTYYGKEITRILGSKRTLEGEGIYALDSRPARTASVPLDHPLVLEPMNIDATYVRVQWPRFFLLFSLPFLWLFANSLPNHRDTQSTDIALTSIIAVVLSLITAMAFIARTDVSVHPDELTHVASARYYYDNWLKPQIGSPETMDAHKTNRYGVAYLTSVEPIYQLSAKFSVLTWPIFQNDVIGLRMFNVTLFFLLAVIASQAANVRIAIIPLFITPQAWYIFSYFNGDGLPLFFSILLIAITLDLFEHNNYRVANVGGLTRKSFIVGCLSAGVLLSKPNYWPIFGVVGLYVIARKQYLTKGQFTLMLLGWMLALGGTFFLLHDGLELPRFARLAPLLAGASILVFAAAVLIKSMSLRHKPNPIQINLLAATVVGMALVLGLKMIDETRHNPAPFTAERSEAIDIAREEAAKSEYRPSAMNSGNIEKSHRLAAQGTAVTELLLEKSWIESSVRSLLGVYGYMNIYPPAYIFYPLLMAFIAVISIVFFTVNQFAAAGSGYATTMSLFIGFVTVTAASIGFSWIYDYQPQGRYLLAILPIIGGALIVAGSKALRSGAIRLTIAVSFLFSLASFLLVAMKDIPKAPGVY